MKKQIFTQLSKVLLVVLVATLSTSAYAEKRYYLVGDESTSTGAPDQIYFGIDDVHRQLWIWDASNQTISVSGAEDGITGNYLQCTVLGQGWLGFNYALLAGATMDMTDVTEDWFLHIAIKTNIPGAITMGLGGANKTSANYDFTTDRFPVADRNNTWKEFEIPMYLLTDLKLDYKSAPLAGVMSYLSFVAGAAKGTLFAVDNMYIHNNITALNDVKADKLDFSIKGDLLVLKNAVKASIYNMQGAIVIDVTEGLASLVNLPKGVYIIKGEGKTSKFTR